MTEIFTAACVQNCASLDPKETTDRAEYLIREAAAEGADLICTPEFFSCLDTQLSGLGTDPHTEETHPALPRFRSLAEELGKWFLLGSITILGDDTDDRLFNRSYLINPLGRIVARYNKIHLFDIDIEKKEVYREPNQFQPGKEAVLASTPWGLLGMTVCYDVRFAYLYRALAKAGASILMVPAAFTRQTGRAHWHILLQARAIETGCFVVASAQCGDHEDGRETYGHSLIVAPWGEILADGGEEPCIVMADLDFTKIDKARGMVPALSHDRDFAPPIPIGLKVAGE